MTAASILPSAPIPSRHPSVDILRGLIMFTMLFVNDIAGAPNVPPWLKHFAPPLANGITFVDLVFPAFLFVVGLSIPLALQARHSRGASTLSTLSHILLRSASLLLLGVVMVNFRGWGPWPLFALLASIAAFLHIGALSRRANVALRLTGFLALAVLILTYPRFHPDHPFHPQWWGILGLIGWAYLVSALIYLATGPSRPLLITALALLIALYFATAQPTHANLFHHLSLFGFAPAHWIDIGPHLGSHSAITLAGVLLGTALIPSPPLPANPSLPPNSSPTTNPPLTHPAPSLLSRSRFPLLLALGLSLGALLTYPSFGLNKTLATPAWSLLAASLTTLLFLPLHLLTDPNPSLSRSPAPLSPAPLSPALTPPAPPPSPRPHFVTLSLGHFLTLSSLLGASALLVYLLQPLFFRLLSLAHLPYNDLAPTPLLAATRALLASTLLSALTITLHHHQIRLKL